MAKCPDLHPLVIVPVHDIVATYRVNLDLPVYQNKNGLTKNNHNDFGELFQFEIFNSNGDYPYNETFIRELEDKGTQNQNTVNIDENEGFKLWTQHEEYRRTCRHSNNKTRKVFFFSEFMLLIRIGVVNEISSSSEESKNWWYRISYTKRSNIYGGKSGVSVEVSKRVWE